MTLHGIRVLELGQYIAAPYCAMLLADQGAEVIKLERPGVGDPRRAYDPLVQRNGRSMSGGFMSYNRNKKSLTLNLADPSGRQLFSELIETVDVVVENLRPGSMDRLGLGWEALSARNSRLIYCAISGFGREPGKAGPYGSRPAFDTAIQAMSGMMSLVGEPGGDPCAAPSGFADIYTAVYGALAVSLALFARERTGRGTFIDQAMYDSLASLMERPLMLHAFTGQVPERGIDRFAPVGALRASDGFVAMIIPTDEMWRRFCEAIERPDLADHPDLATVLGRAEHFRDLIKPEAEEWTATRSRSEVAERFISVGLPVGEVQTIDEVFSCPHLEARGMMIVIRDEVTGPMRLPRTPLAFSEYTTADGSPPPELGGDTRELLTQLVGASTSDLDRWAAGGVI